jgi:KUP system potassium uptake protein
MSEANGQTVKPSPTGIILLLSVLGVVYGDIGTSALYALRICFSFKGAAAITPQNVIGVVSLIIWALVIIISIKYCIFVLRADNKGEGGMMALMTLARKNAKTAAGGIAILMLGLFGTALLYGDGMITPVISVISAVEGLNTISPFFAKAVIPISMIILIFLFYFQHLGSGQIGSIFGPIMLVWFLVLGVLGLASIIKTPLILRAFNPVYAFEFIRHNFFQAVIMLGGIFLVLTGGEAMYADMGHFGKTKIRMGWFFVVFPALILNYLGQGAILIRDPSSIHGLFYRLAPSWMIFPLVILATMATIIASQAVISGAFSIARQSVQLGFLPRLKIVHTSQHTVGQIYIPFVNTILLIGAVILILAFKSSDKLANAYGVAVSTDMLFTSFLLFRIARTQWKWSRLASSLIIGLFLVIDCCFFLSNLSKIGSGGYIPLVIALIVFLIMNIWYSERQKMYAIISREALAEEYLLAEIRKNKPYRPDGVGVYLSGSPSGVPRTLLHNFKHNKVIHKTVVFLTVVSKDVPFVENEDRITVKPLGLGFFRILLSYGFSEKMDVPAALKSITQEGLKLDPLKVTYFLGKENLIILNKPFFENLSRTFFAFMSKNSRDASSYYNLPPNRIIELGIQMEI